jgi:F-type H+-transporting ATPase subunit b
MEALGLNSVLIVAQATSFLILYFVFSKFLYPRIQSALKDRRDSVAKTFSDRAEIEKRLASLEEEMASKRKELASLRKSAEAEARKSGESAGKEILAAARDEASREVDRTRDRIRLELDSARKQLGAEAKKLTDQMLRKLIESKSSDSAWQDAQLDRSLKDLKNLKT